MLKRYTLPSILAKAAIGRPKLKRMHYIVDLCTLNVGLYQTYDGAYNSLTQSQWGNALDINYNGLWRKLKEKESVIINNRLLVGLTEHLYYRMLKIDKVNTATMAVNTPIQDYNIEFLPTILADYRL